MSSHGTSEPANIIETQETEVAEAPTTFSLATAGNNGDLDATFDADMNAAWANIVEAPQVELAIPRPSSVLSSAPTPEDFPEIPEEETEKNFPSELMSKLNRLQAELDVANATNQTEWSARKEADVIVEKEKKEREEEITSLKDQIKDLREQLESSMREKDHSASAYTILHSHHETLIVMAKKSEEDKRAISATIGQLKAEFEVEKRLRGVAEQTANGATLQLSTADRLLEQRTKDIASLRDDLQRLRSENSSGAQLILTEQQAWAKERQNFVGQIESLEAIISGLKAEKEGNSPYDDLADQMRCLKIDSPEKEAVLEPSIQCNILITKVETARSEGYEAGCQETRELAESKHQEILLEHRYLLDEANSCAEATEKSKQESVTGFEAELAQCRVIISEASARFSLVEKEHAEQIAWHENRIAEADRLASQADSDKSEAVRKASLREEDHAELEARFKRAQVDLEHAKKREAQEQATKEFYRVKDDQVALLWQELEKEQSKSSDRKEEIAKLEASLAAERSRNEDNKRQITALTARLNRETEKGTEREKKAKGELEKLKEGQKRQVAKLIANLVAERARKAPVSARQKLPALVEHRRDPFGLSVFFVVACIAVVALRIDSSAIFATSDMHACGVRGDSFTLCKN
ncbi:hypothetical protein OIDMADRAFT_49729 [Oidiodendron maius Zn]|uniref:Uncharacterized protein n=1 Tax=Oidiodendron maius (strain Zn) TaxID=913774 RepID=A0A0C3HVJ7_OIDMZ|nr:hypothetical protein OIDMADRAFT_49729 [Oidiodendron maius Zn]